MDEDLLNEGRRNIRDYLQGQGFFDAEVQVRQDEETQPDTQHIVYSIQPGRQHKLRAIELEGNKRFDARPCASAWGRRLPTCSSRTATIARPFWPTISK